MHAAADRPEFEPPPQRGLIRAGALALVAHLLLVVALTYGLRWKNEAENVSAEAELWSALPQEAAPKEIPTPPPPPPAIVRAPPLPEPPVQRDADIALEQEKKKRELAERKQAELEREREKRKKLEAERKREEERERKELLAKQAADKKKEEDRKRKLEQDAKKMAQQREENLKRMQGMAGTGAPSATGNAARSSGPSDSWAGRVRARVKPNIVFSEDISGNPAADVEVRMAPDGTIVGKRLVKSSGVKAWDDAVLRALDKTEMLPRDVDGRVHSPVVISFKPKG